VLVPAAPAEVVAPAAPPAFAPALPEAAPVLAPAAPVAAPVEPAAAVGLPVAVPPAAAPVTGEVVEPVFPAVLVPPVEPAAVAVVPLPAAGVLVLDAGGVAPGPPGGGCSAPHAPKVSAAVATRMRELGIEEQRMALRDWGKSRPWVDSRVIHSSEPHLTRNAKFDRARMRACRCARCSVPRTRTLVSCAVLPDSMQLAQWFCTVQRTAASVLSAAPSSNA
jgi:hypothetical protein